MLKRLPGVRMLFLEGLNLGAPLLETNLKVATALADPSVTSDLGLKAGLSGLELLVLSLQC
ncbi:hypothetical protein D3C80_1633020 [compost metagenome]